MHFQKLDVWKISHQLALEVYTMTGKFDKEERYALTQQMRRAAASIPMNIAEGNAVGYPKAYVRHLYIARGSNAEVQYQLFLSKDLGYINEQDYENAIELTQRIEMMTNKLISKISNEYKSADFNVNR